MLAACHQIAGEVGGGARLCGQEDLQDIQVVTAAPHEALSCLRPSSGTEIEKIKARRAQTGTAVPRNWAASHLADSQAGGGCHGDHWCLCMGWVPTPHPDLFY